MEDRQIDPEAMQAPAWLHLQNLKKLAKIVKQVAVTVHSKGARWTLSLRRILRLLGRASPAARP